MKLPPKLPKIPNGLALFDRGRPGRFVEQDHHLHRRRANLFGEFDVNLAAGINHRLGLDRLHGNRPLKFMTVRFAVEETGMLLVSSGAFLV